MTSSLRHAPRAPRKTLLFSAVLALSLAACDDVRSSAEPTDDAVDQDGVADDPSAPGSGDAPDDPKRPANMDSGTPSMRPSADGAAPIDVRPHVDAGTERSVPAPPATAIYVPEYPQSPGDPKKGYDYLVNGEYMRLGVNLDALKSTQPTLGPEEQLAGRRGDNVGLSYTFNATTSDKGERIAAINCVSCHATPLMGKLVIGLGRPNRLIKFDHINAPGLVIASPPGISDSLTTTIERFAGITNGVIDTFAYVASHRDPKTLVWSDTEQFPPDAAVVGWVDIGAWWRLKKKHGIYSTGVGRGDHRSHMSFASLFSITGVSEAAEIEKNFSDVNAYLRSIEPPKFPGKINPDLVAQGEPVFFKNCATCHGTYGENWTYPNVIIPYQEVGTDPSLAKGHWLKPVVQWYKDSWYNRNGDTWMEVVEGYYAPPLDGVWATAPFFHNGSVPTLDGVIDPKKRPDVWTTDMTEDDFDLEKVGWKDKPFDFDLTVDLDLGRFDAAKEGNSNQGHNYGAHLDEAEQKALLEYLKTL